MPVQAEPVRFKESSTDRIWEMQLLDEGVLVRMVGSELNIELLEDEQFIARFEESWA